VRALSWPRVSRSPLPLRPDPCPPKTRSDLEWDRLLGAVAERCAGPLGRDYAERLEFATTREDARRWLEEAQEATRLLDAGSPLPVTAIEGVGDAIERTRVGGVLGPVELRAIGRMLGAARVLRRFLSARKAELPALYDACSTDPMLDGVADEIARSFEPDGTLADSASPRLRDLRGEWHAARQRVLSRMDDLMQRYESVLQDHYVTEREGRWVLPVRSDAHERFPGIVHTTSTSGATLFVEPRAIVPMGNRLKVLEAEVKREEDAVYARLTGQIGDVLESARAARDALARADFRAATARLAHDLRLTFPEVVDEPRLDLRRARHPLLELDFLARAPAPGRSAGEVVPSDVAIEAGRAIIVSGPNAGGKTVALKTMGLVALMVRSGLPVPCAESTVVGLFDVVLTDVGDDQSLHKNLSTFSAHVSNLAGVLEDTTKGALVLLDELAGGTDPREGEALAAGVLDSLCMRGGAVATTTHYEGLKALALVDTRFVNASVGFDLKTMTPTFELAMGVPGSSSALAVARRFGMPSTVIDRAERFLAREDRNFETVVQRLHGERAALELARAAAEEREREAEGLRTQLDAELEAAKNRERRALSQEAQELMDRLRRARDDLRDAQARLRTKKADAQTIREAGAALDRVAREVAIGGPLEHLVTGSSGPNDAERAAVTLPELRKGLRVWVPRLRAEAEVVDILGGGDVRVAAGALKLTMPASELRAATASETVAPRSTGRGRGPAAGAPPSAVGPAVQVRDNTCDLRGLRVDDGLAMATSFLDRALNDGRDVVFLLHGHGTGAMRDAVRKDLSRSPYVARFSAAAPDQGGEGVTVVWLS
jgi:DNA mismatch repair protein MutS2